MATQLGINRQQARPVSGRVPIWSVLGPALLSAIVLGAFALYGTLNPYSAPMTPPSATIAGGLSWGGTILWTKPQVKSWLRAHGAAYPTWKRRHPAAYAIVVRPKQQHAPAVKRKHAGARKSHRAP